jgi:hypothetical protein
MARRVAEAVVITVQARVRGAERAMMLVLKAVLLFVSGWVVVIGFAISLGGGDPNVYWYMCVSSYFLTIFAAWLLHILAPRGPRKATRQWLSSGGR